MMTLEDAAEFLNSKNDEDSIGVIYSTRHGGHVTIVALKLVRFRYVPECDAILIETEAYKPADPKKQEKIPK
jgi:hypothetical protein